MYMCIYIYICVCVELLKYNNKLVNVLPFLYEMFFCEDWKLKGETTHDYLVNIYLFKVNMIDIILISLLLTLNVFHNFFLKFLLLILSK